MTAPNTIFQLLTLGNPRVTHYPLRKKARKNSQSVKWHYPRLINGWKDWEDSNLLRKTFDGRLLAHVNLPRELPHPPRLVSSADCQLRTEEGTKRVIYKWTEVVVNAALEPIQFNLNATIWTTFGDLPKPRQTYDVPRRQPTRNGTKRSPNRATVGRLFPDGGAGYPSADAEQVSIERFPKEYKPFQKWSFQEVVRENLIDSNGEWVNDGQLHNLAQPINQAFTYCVEFNCRYGCILTCHEAFLFRVRPIADDSGNPKFAGNDEASHQHLINSVAKKGLLEYVLVPWDNAANNDIPATQDWTINLAFWYLHILAGNNYKIDWIYPLLVAETLSAETPLAENLPADTLTPSVPTTEGNEAASILPADVSRSSPVAEQVELPSPRDTTDEEAIEPSIFEASPLANTSLTTAIFTSPLGKRKWVADNSDGEDGSEEESNGERNCGVEDGDSTDQIHRSYSENLLPPSRVKRPKYVEELGEQS